MALPPPCADSTALVTGASSGIGVEIARALAARGHGVTLAARRDQPLRRLAAELTTEHSIRAEAIAADLAEASDRDRLAAAIEALGLSVEILVNNAGVGSYGSFSSLSREAELAMVRLNVEAVTDLQARYLPAMVERGRGAVINISSTSAFQPMPGMATYAASKAFVLNQGEALHQELKGSGVTVTTVCPGPIQTDFAETSGTDSVGDDLPEMFWMSPEELAEDAIEAAEQGKRGIVPGGFNRAGSLLGRWTPRTAVLPLVDRFFRRDA